MKLELTLTQSLGLERESFLSFFLPNPWVKPPGLRVFAPLCQEEVKRAVFVFSIVFFSLHNEKKIPSRVFVFFCLQCKGMGTGRPESNPPRRLHFRTTPIEKVRVGWLPVPLTSASNTGCQRFGSEP